MSYNPRSDYERARLQSEGKQLEADRGNLEASVQALEAEYASLQAAASGIAERIALASEAAESPQPSVSLEDRVSVGEGNGDGLEALTRQLRAIQARLGQIPAEISTKRSEIAQVAARFQALISQGRGLLGRDSDLQGRLTGTTYGIKGEASGISGQNSGAKTALEGSAAKTSGWQGTLTQQVAQDAEVLSWLEGSAAGHSTSSASLGHIDVDAILGPATYGEPRYTGIHHIELSLRKPAGIDTYAELWSRVPGADPLGQATTRDLEKLVGLDAYAELWSRVPGADPLGQATSKASSVLQRGAYALPTYVSDMLYNSRLTRPYQPLQKVGEIAYDRTKSVGKSVVQYVAQAASYLTSAIGSYLGRER